MVQKEGKLLVTGVGLPHCFKWLPLGEVPVVLGVRERKATLYPSPSRIPYFDKVTQSDPFLRTT